MMIKMVEMWGESMVSNSYVVSSRQKRFFSSKDRFMAQGGENSFLEEEGSKKILAIAMVCDLPYQRNRVPTDMLKVLTQVYSK